MRLQRGRDDTPEIPRLWRMEAYPFPATEFRPDCRKRPSCIFVAKCGLHNLKIKSERLILFVLVKTRRSIAA